MLKLKSDMIKIGKNQRLHGLDIPIIGLTGGIATGKSTVSNLMKHDGICIIDADALIKEIYNYPETLDFIKKVAPACIKNNQIYFPQLRQLFFSDLDLKQQIEAFLYLHMPEAFKRHVHQDATFVVYDVPLLFEKELQTKVDISVLVYAPKDLQFQRLIKRDQITPELAHKILNQQMDIEIKKSKCDYIIDNSQDLTQLKQQYLKLKQEIFN